MADASAPLSIPQLCLCGFLSGAIVSFIMTPVELVKCKMQVQGVALHDSTSSRPIYKGPWDIVQQTWKSRGFFGMYQGHTGTFLRESGGGAAWFGTYEFVCKKMIDQDKTRRSKEDLSPWHLMGAGALAGMAYNLTLFPADVIKSRQQTMEGSVLARSGFREIAVDLYKAQGIKGFYRGCGITVARSAPTSAVIFATYIFSSFWRGFHAHVIKSSQLMDFSNTGPQKETAAQRARRERQERDAKKKIEESNAKRIAASQRIIAWYRRQKHRRSCWTLLIASWDSWTSYSEQGETPSPSQKAVTSSIVPWDLVMRIGVFERFYVKSKESHSGRLAHICKKFLQPEETNAWSLLFDGPRFSLVSKIFSKFLWICWERVCGPESSLSSSETSWYLTGPEVRFLVAFWDVSKWLKTPKSRSAALQSRYAVIDRGLFQLIGGASAQRIYVFLRLVAKKTKTPGNDRLQRNTVLWLTATLRMSMLSLGRRSDGEIDNQEPYLVLFLSYIVSVPFLCNVLDQGGLVDLTNGMNLAAAASLMRNIPSLFAGFIENVRGELALCFAANIAVLLKTAILDKKVTLSESSVQDIVWLLHQALSDCNRYVMTSQTNKSKYHPVFQWYSGPLAGIPNDLYSHLLTSMSFLRSGDFVRIVFAEILEYPFMDGTPAILATKGFLFNLIQPRRQMQAAQIPSNIENLCELLSRFYLDLSGTFQTMRMHTFNVLVWTPGLISQLWRLICAKNESLLDTASNQRSADLYILELFVELCLVLFITLDDEDIYEKQKPFTLIDVTALCILLNNFCFSVFRTTSSTAIASTTKSSNQRRDIANQAKKIISYLYDKNERRSFGSESLNWIKKEATKSSFLRELKEKRPEAVVILEHMPFAIPFRTRVDIFRSMVQAEASSKVGNGISITVNRTRVLEDGFSQLQSVSIPRLKSTIRVKFVNQYGLPEAGIDQNGVFKEFLEDLCKGAFARDFNLFRSTLDGNCTPSTTSSIHEEHLQLFEFVGKMLGKALLEGIVIDIPFATYVYAKMLGKMTFLHYSGNAEDLGLTFTVDSEDFGQVRSKGGSNIMFSPSELKRLMSGDTVDFNVEDLRRHSRYEGGYHDAHPTIRSLWQVVQELEEADRTNRTQ
ncbi:Ubiquitin-protein ligase E3B [Phlyctochytrium planicorne]|nr:Ubiquitin-protein ligase E3B [Phlyctochytrium planicorne]